MARITGYIEHPDRHLKDGSLYVGWVGSKPREPADERDVMSGFGKVILAHGGHGVDW